MCYLLKYQPVEVIHYCNVPHFGGSKQSVVLLTYNVWNLHMGENNFSFTCFVIL